MAVWNVIDHTELTGSAATYDVSSIPTDGTYDHLYLAMSVRTDSSGFYESLYLRFNGDSGSNYSAVALYAGTTTPSSNKNDSVAQIENIYVSTASHLADTFSPIRIWIPNYANSANFKPLFLSSNAVGNSSTNNQWYVSYTGGMWADTDAIDQLTVTIAGGDSFVEYSTFTLYGLVGA